MTATQPDPDGGMTRRGVMRRTAIGIGAAATLGGASTGAVTALTKTDAAVIAGTTVIGGPAAAIGYALKRGYETFTGDTNEDYLEKAKEEVRAQMHQNALTMKQTDTAVLGNFQNLLSSSANHVISNAKKAAVDSLNSGGTTQEAKDAALAEVDTFYAIQQENFLAHLGVQGSKISGWVDEWLNNHNDNTYQLFGMGSTQQAITRKTPGVSTTSVTLVDGTNFGYDIYEFDNGNGVIFSTEVTSNVEREILYSYNPDQGNWVEFFNMQTYKNIWSSINSEHSTISSEMGTWVDNVGPEYQVGDIDTTDLISAGDLVGDSQTQDGYSFAGASLASLGLQSSKFALEIELLDDEITVEGAIYHSDDSIDNLQKDNQYDPNSDIAGTVYIAYNDPNTEQGELVELNQPFIIRSITDGEGNSYNAANYESKNQQTYSTEITEIQKELEQISQLRQELEEQRDAAALDDTTSGGGGGFLAEAGQTYTLGLAALAAAGVVLLGRN